MKCKYAFLVLTASVPCLSFAQGSQTYYCSYGDLERRVEILTEPGVSVPCEVHYYKDTEAPGERQVLWSATAEAGYCERKTTEFIGKLLSWGWSCGQGDDTAGSSETVTEAEPIAETEVHVEPADDTEALAPVEATESSDVQ